MERREKVQYIITNNLFNRVDDEEWEVISLSNPDEVHTVMWSGIGGECDCTGYEYRGWCTHLEVVKRMSPTPEPNDAGRKMLDEVWK